MKIWSFLLAGFALGAVALADEDIWSKTINNDTNGVWNLQPEKPKAKVIKVDDPHVDHAFRIKATKGVNPWDLQANSPVQGAINQGDVIMLMYYARAEVPAAGGSSLAARIQINAAPYTSVMEMTSAITTEWKNYCAHRVASGDVPAKGGNVSIHLATADQVIDLGPVFVFNFGKDYNEKKLKGCDG
jgi:Carbohydrate binding domain